MVQVLLKMRIKWSTVHAQFSRFNSRPSARGGFDWKFNKEEWVNTIKVLNMGLSEAWIAQTFEALDDGSGWVEFTHVQEVLLCSYSSVRSYFFLSLGLGASVLSYKVMYGMYCEDREAYKAEKKMVEISTAYLPLVSLMMRFSAVGGEQKLTLKVTK